MDDKGTTLIGVFGLYVGQGGPLTRVHPHVSTHTCRVFLQCSHSSNTEHNPPFFLLSSYETYFRYPFAHENDPLYATQCALDIRAQMSTLKINCKIGVTTGEVFAGCVGNDRRCEYAVIGPKVGREERERERERERWGKRERWEERDGKRERDGGEERERENGREERDGKRGREGERGREMK